MAFSTGSLNNINHLILNGTQNEYQSKTPESHSTCIQKASRSVRIIYQSDKQNMNNWNQKKVLSESNFLGVFVGAHGGWKLRPEVFHRANLMNNTWELAHHAKITAQMLSRTTHVSSPSIEACAGDAFNMFFDIHPCTDQYKITKPRIHTRRNSLSKADLAMNSKNKFFYSWTFELRGQQTK